MASLNFIGLQKVQVTNKKYQYIDLHLDFSNPIVRDLQTDNDEAAIRNSIYNLFNTTPGQNLLNPNYGMNLIKYVFEPASPSIGREIGNTILKNLSNFEPRVVVNNVNVEVNPDEQMYIITLSIGIPQFNQNIKIPGILTKTGYTFL